MGLSAKELIAKVSAPERTFDICLDGRLRSERDAVEAELNRVQRESVGKMGDSPEAAELREQLDHLNAQMADATVAFRFRGLSHWRFKEIQRRFPTEERGMVWDVDKGASTLIAECLVDPILTADEVQELLEAGNQRLADEFIGAAVLVCQQENSVPKSGRGSGGTGASGSR